MNGAFRFECDHCGAANEAAPDGHGTRVELIDWVRETNPRLKYTLRVRCSSCPTPTCWSVCAETAFEWRTRGGVHVREMFGLTGEFILDMLGVDQ